MIRGELLGWILSGMVSTLLMDVWSVFARETGIQSGAVKPSLIGRWFAHLIRGKVAHEPISATPTVTGELVLGIAVHYSIGAILGIIFFSLLSASPGWSAMYLGVIFGLGTNIFPWLILFPSYGFGLGGLRGKGLFKSSLLNHLAYGIGLGLCAIFLER